MTPVTTERVRVRYGETDMMGHAYYANYLYWFEQARGAWCRDRGFTYKQLEGMGFKLPVVEVWTRYKGEVKYDDWIAIKVWLGERKRAAIKFQYEVVNEETGKLVTEGYTWHVFVGAAMSAVTIPEEIKAMLARDPAEWETLA
ncbi:MAG: acyl-CoA thioesterase [Armatimonadetes bacterium]|nr:acyl-CoA thioesterase [Armatimonadota bacterium]